MSAANNREKKKYSLHPENIVVVIQLPYFDDGITKLTHFKVEKRGFVPAYELDDWLETDQEIAPR